MSQMEQSGSAHPLFQMSFEDDVVVSAPPQEGDDQIEERVESLLGEQGAGLLTPDPPTPPAQPPAAEAAPAEPGEMSQHALLALSYQKTHGLIPDTEEIPKDLTAEGLQELLVKTKSGVEQKSAEEWEKERIESVKAQLEAQGITKKDFELLAHLKSGGNPVAVSRYEELRQWATDAPEDDDDKLETIRFAAELTGQKKEFVDAYIDANLTTAHEIETAFKEAQKTIEAAAEKVLAEDKQRLADAVEKQRKDWETFESSVKTTASKGFKGIQLNKAEQQQLVDYMTKRTVAVDVVENGQKVRKLITPYQDFGRKLLKDVEENMAFAYYSMKGSVGMINAAAETANDKFLAASLAAASKNKGSGTLSSQEDVATGEILTQIGFS